MIPWALENVARAARQIAEGEPVRSPCQAVCRIDAASGWCEGCLRTLDEIVAWSTLDAQGQREIWDRIVQRLPLANATPSP